MYPPGLGFYYHERPRGREVHVTTTSHAISTFMSHDRSSYVCFRCGQSGHVRFQCLQFKIRLCMHFAAGNCTDKNCSFAHGEGELRTPWTSRCVRVVKQAGKLVCIGCNATDHTFRNCPRHSSVSSKIRANESMDQLGSSALDFKGSPVSGEVGERASHSVMALRS